MTSNRSIVSVLITVFCL